VAHTCNHSAGEAKAGGSQIPEQTWAVLRPYHEKKEGRKEGKKEGRGKKGRKGKEGGKMRRKEDEREGRREGRKKERLFSVKEKAILKSGGRVTYYLLWDELCPPKSHTLKLSPPGPYDELVFGDGALKR
jgi:hypothetical protein